MFVFLLKEYTIFKRQGTMSRCFITCIFLFGMVCSISSELHQGNVDFTEKRTNSICDEKCRCPDGYMRFGKSCYLFTQTLAKWTDAYVYCQMFGGHLVNIESAVEQRHIDTFLKFIRPQTPKYWTGGTAKFSQGHWYWTTVVKPATFTNWAPNKPDSDEQHCISLYGNGQWDDDHCEKARHFICEKELD